MTQDKAVMAMVSTPEHPECGETLSLTFTVEYNGDIARLPVSELYFKLPSGIFAEDLTDGFSGVELHPQADWDLHLKDGIFIAKPSVGTSIDIGDHGLVFTISNLIVNSEPGQVMITMGQIVGPQNTKFEQTTPVTKVHPRVKIYNLQATPSQSIDYHSPVNISWAASVGSVLMLEYNGIEIHHAKGDTSVPLASVGTYLIDDNLGQSTIFTLHAHAGPKAAPSNPATLQTTVSIAPPQITVTAAVSIAPGEKPKATITWDSKSTTEIEISTALAAGDNAIRVPASPPKGPPQPLPNGSISQEVLVDTTYTVTAKNPATIDTTVAKTTVKVPAFDWLAVQANTPRTTTQCFLFETHAGLLWMNGADDDSRVDSYYTSADGLNWVRGKNLPPIAPNFAVNMVHYGDTTFLSAGTVVGLQARLYCTKDFITWTQLPLSEKRQAQLPSSIAFDDKGTAWAVTAYGERTVYKSTDQMQSWTAVGHTDFTEGSVNLSFMGGQLWALGAQQFSGYTIIASSSDGANWTRHHIAGEKFTFGQRHAAVVKDQLCFFVDILSDAPNGFGALSRSLFWRIDAAGTLTKDPNYKERMDYVTVIGGDICHLNGTLFAIGSDYSTATTEIWARKI